MQLFVAEAHAAFAPAPVLPVDAGVAGAHDAFEACRAEVGRWPPAANGGCDIRVVHSGLPAQLCPLGSSTFLLPVDGAQPLLASDPPRAAQGRHCQGRRRRPPLASLDDVMWSSLLASRQRALGACAASLAGLLRSSGIKPTLFALGTTSLLLTRELNQHLPSSLSSSEQTTAEGAAAPVQPEASVLIVDRSLDFVAPSLATDHPLDVLLASAARADANAAAATSSVNALPRPLSPPLAGSAQGGGGVAEVAAAAVTARHLASGRRHPCGVPPPPPRRPGRPSLPRCCTRLAVLSLCASLFDAVLTRRSKEVGQQLLKGLASVADDYETEEDDEDEGGGRGR